VTLEPGLVDRLVRAALEEDLHQAGDLTSELTIAADAVLRAAVIARQAGTVAGLPLAERAFLLLDDRVRFHASVEDGAEVTAGQTLASIEGPARAIMTGERVALNFLGQLSGVASLTAAYVRAVSGTGTRILDTRKTHPGLRAVEKYAVRMGGGHNHRFGLYDGVLIKDNHIAAAGGIARALDRVRGRVPALTGIEVEVETLAQVEEALAGGATTLLLDNMAPDLLRDAVALVAGRARTEASGGVTLDSVGAIAATGVDFISVGALTHSAPTLDIALEVLG
jgi:nicotinate-nucleotide pyrophosphorylase (carboxylating)